MYQNTNIDALRAEVISKGTHPEQEVEISIRMVSHSKSSPQT